MGAMCNSPIKGFNLQRSYMFTFKSLCLSFPSPFPLEHKVTHTNIEKKNPGPNQNKDAHHTQVHFHRPRDADLVEQFCRDKLPSDDIYVPAHHQPVNPEDEDDVVPDQHAAFGIQRATQARREPAWRDFGLGELMGRGPEAGAWRGVGRGGGAGGGVGAGGAMGRKGPSKMPR